MIFEGKNLDDWFKLPNVRGIKKTDKGVVLDVAFHVCENWFVPAASLHIGDTLIIKDDGSIKIIRCKHGNNTNIRA